MVAQLAWKRDLSGHRRPACRIERALELRGQYDAIRPGVERAANVVLAPGVGYDHDSRVR